MMKHDNEDEAFSEDIHSNIGVGQTEDDLKNVERQIANLSVTEEVQHYPKVEDEAEEKSVPVDPSNSSLSDPEKQALTAAEVTRTSDDTDATSLSEQNV